MLKMKRVGLFELVLKTCATAQLKAASLIRGERLKPFLLCLSYVDGRGGYFNRYSCPDASPYHWKFVLEYDSYTQALNQAMHPACPFSETAFAGSGDEAKSSRVSTRGAGACVHQLSHRGAPWLVFFGSVH